MSVKKLAYQYLLTSPGFQKIVEQVRRLNDYIDERLEELTLDSSHTAGEILDMDLPEEMTFEEAANWSDNLDPRGCK